MKKAITLLCAVMLLAALVIPASAAMTPSVEQKGAPTVAEKGITVTALADAAKDPQVKKTMEAAVESLTKETNLTKAVSNLADAAKKVSTTVKTENLVVRDLFYVAADETMKEGETKTLTFKNVEGLKKGDFLMVMVMVDGEWVILDAEDVEITANGQVKVTFEVMGAVAFVTENTAK